MRGFATSVAVALFLLGCSAPKGEPIELLTGGGEGCYPGPSPTLQGPLLVDPEFGTAIKVESSHTTYPFRMEPNGTVLPVMWPTSYTGLRLAGGEVAVLNREGKVVAKTGGRYAIGQQVLTDGNGAFPACEVSEVKEALRIAPPGVRGRIGPRILV